MQRADRVLWQSRIPPLARVTAAWLTAAALAGCASGNGRRPGVSPAAGNDEGSRPGRSAEAGELDRYKVTRAEELFVGRFPGVRVLLMPSGDLSLRIRGQSTLLGNSEPLFVVDGMPLAAGSGGLVALNPADIQRIEVLKDIGSTAYYGVRGANGVVLITTKRQ